MDNNSSYFTKTSWRLSELFLFSLIFFNNWRTAALQCCVGFCHTTQTGHKYTHVPPSLETPSHPPPHPTPLCCHRGNKLIFEKGSGSDGKASAYNAGDPGSIPGSGGSPGEGNGNPLQYSCLEIPWMEEPGRPQSMGSQRVGPDWATSLEKGSKQCLIHTKCLLLFLPQLKRIIRLVNERSVARLKFLRAGTMSVLLTTVSSGIHIPWHIVGTQWFLN